MEEKSRPTVYFSNKLEHLAEALGESLFQPGKDPFAESVVFLPHHSLKSYLNFFFASHPKWNISAGIKYKTLLEGIMELLEERIPSKAALSFIIERILHEEDLSSDEKKLWIAEELSAVFCEYRLFEPAALEKWLEEDGWKQDLYRKLFSNTCIETLLKEKEGLKNAHLFGFANLQSHFCDFFTKSASTFYFLSPTEMFWEDLVTDKERIYLEKKMVGDKVRLQVQEQMSFFLKKNHPILANFGKAGRALLTHFGQVECFLEERYEPPISSSTLTFMQESLFHLEDGEEKKEALSVEDTSFLLVSATSKLREVEVLLETLQEAVGNSSLQPKDILVLSPDLDKYFPYIQAVFSQKSSPFSFSLHGLSPLCIKKEAKELFFFFNLIEGRFELESFLTFLSSISEKWDFKEKDLKAFKEVLEKVHVLWGLSQEHKECLLASSWPEGTPSLEVPSGGTLLEGLKKVISSLAVEIDSPLLSLTEVETFGRLIEVVELLEKELRPIYQKEKKTFREWVDLVEKLLGLFFMKSRESESLLSSLHTLQIELKDESFPLSYKGFKRALDPYFHSKKESAQSHHLNAVKFLSLEMDGLYPADLIYVLGCDEDSIPKREITSSLNEMQKFKKSPSSADKSRYLFLELLLHAKKSLIFSYERISSKDGKEQGPSRLLEEILSYIDEHGYFEKEERPPSEVFTRHHPAMSFSKSYFEKGSLFSSYSPKVFSQARSYYLEEKKEFSSFLQEKEEASFSKTIDIKKLEEFTKSPTRSYLKETLGIFFPLTPPKDKEFFFSALSKAGAKKRALSVSLEKGVQETKASGELPLGELGKMGEEDLQKDLLDWKEGLEFFGLKESDLMLVEFVEGARKVEIIEGKVISPPLILEVEEVGEVKLVGHLHPISSKGFVFFNKKKKGDFSTFWPSWLIYLCLAKELNFSSSLLLIHERKSVEDAPIKPALWLSKYLKLYFKALEFPCKVRSDWVTSLVLKEGLESKVTPSSYDIGYMDPYEEWIEGRDPPLMADTLKKEWEEPWREAFSFFVKKEGEHVEV